MLDSPLKERDCASIPFKRMNWQITHPDTAECISFDMQAICYLPAAENKTTDGAALDAGYYYYDPLSGVSKLKKL